LSQFALWIPVVSIKMQSNETHTQTQNADKPVAAFQEDVDGQKDPINVV